MATHAHEPHDVGIDALLDSSPEPGVHASGAAEFAVLLGVSALAASFFSLTSGAAVAAGVAALVLAAIGMVATSNPRVAGRGMVPTAFALAIAALVVVGLRYIGLDTAYGDMAGPTLVGWLDSLNTRLGL
jgi:hypothetical protein